jgi:hypothetical protein
MKENRKFKTAATAMALAADRVRVDIATLTQHRATAVRRRAWGILATKTSISDGSHVGRARQGGLVGDAFLRHLGKTDSLQILPRLVFTGRADAETLAGDAGSAYGEDQGSSRLWKGCRLTTGALEIKQLRSTRLPR